MPAWQSMHARALQASCLAGVEAQGALVSVGLVGAETKHFVGSPCAKSDAHIEAGFGQVLVPPKLQLLVSASGRVASPGLRRGAHVLRHSRVAWRPSKCGCGQGRCVLRPRHHRGMGESIGRPLHCVVAKQLRRGGKPNPSFKPTASGGGLTSR